MPQEYRWGAQGEPIVSGWGAAPELRAPEIGSLVTGILRNRLGQQELQQQTVADAIKNIQQQRADEAFVQAAQYNKLLPPGDYSGLSAKGAGTLAELIQQQTPDTVLDALNRAKAGWYNRGARGGGGLDQPQPQTYTDPQGVTWRVGAGGRWVPMPKYAQQTGVPDSAYLDPDQTEFGDYTKQTGFVPGPGDYVRVGGIKGDVLPSEQFKVKARRLQGQQQGGTDTTDQTNDAGVTPTPIPYGQSIPNDQEPLPTIGGQGAPATQQTTMPQQRFGSEADARAAGYRANDTVLIFDPDSKQYRAAVLH